MRILERLQKQFPQVKRVVDAKESIRIEVTKRDNDTGRKKDLEHCALANACVRSHIAEHAIIGVGYSYLIVGGTATRYKTSQSVGREITSFDRHHDFAPGDDYLLSKIPESNKMGAPLRKKDRHLDHRRSHNAKVIAHHTTANIRVK